MVFHLNFLQNSFLAKLDHVLISLLLGVQCFEPFTLPYTLSDLQCLWACSLNLTSFEVQQF